MISKLSAPNWQQDFSLAKYYYQVEGRRTFSKTQAFSWARGDADKVQFYFMDDVFDSLDWTQEPQSSMDDLLCMRAREIRDQYSKVSVQYSGGYDSQTIVDTFRKNNLLLDEMIVIKKSYLSQNHWQNLESDKAVQQAQWYRHEIWPNLKITLITLDLDHTVDFFLTHKNGWVDHAGSDLWLSRMSRTHLYNHQSDLVRSVDSFDSHVILEGKEKPRLWIQDGVWCSTMVDSLACWDINSRSTAFYYSNTLPELNLKQTWGMIKWLESMSWNSLQDLHDFLHKVQSHQVDKHVYRDWNYSLGRSPVHNEFSYDPSPLKHRWSGDPRTVEETQVLTKLLAGTKALSYWEQGIKDFMDQWQDTVLDNQKWLRWSKKYRIRPVKINPQ